MFADVIEAKVVGAEFANVGDAPDMIFNKPSKRPKLGLPEVVSPCQRAVSKVCAITATQVLQWVILLDTR